MECGLSAEAICICFLNKTRVWNEGFWSGALLLCFLRKTGVLNVVSAEAFVCVFHLQYQGME
jgi:hypothetical protein